MSQFSWKPRCLSSSDSSSPQRCGPRTRRRRLNRGPAPLGGRGATAASAADRCQTRSARSAVARWAVVGETPYRPSSRGGQNRSARTSLPRRHVQRSEVRLSPRSSRHSGVGRGRAVPSTVVGQRRHGDGNLEIRGDQRPMDCRSVQPGGSCSGVSSGTFTTMPSCVLREITTTAGTAGSGFSSRCGT